MPTLAASNPIKAKTAKGIPKAKGRAGEDVSSWQVSLHPSPETLLPSSHRSFKSITLFPHSRIHEELHPSPLTLFPSSHV